MDVRGDFLGPSLQGAHDYVVIFVKQKISEVFKANASKDKVNFCNARNIASLI